jgi:hypothetical protein
VEGTEIGGGVVEAVEAGGQEIQVVQEGLLLGLAGMVFLEGQLPLEVMGVAAEGRGGEAIPDGQGAARESG